MLIRHSRYFSILALSNASLFPPLPPHPQELSSQYYFLTALVSGHSIYITETVIGPVIYDRNTNLVKQY